MMLWKIILTKSIKVQSSLDISPEQPYVYGGGGCGKLM